jgi:uncharacterized membrane protein
MNGIKSKVLSVFFGVSIILLLFLLIFGVLGTLIIQNNWDYVNIFSSIIIFVGCLITALGVRTIRYPGMRKQLHFILQIVTGMSLVIGGVLYAFTKNISTTITCFAIGAVITTLIFYLCERR